MKLSFLTLRGGVFGHTSMGRLAYRVRGAPTWPDALNLIVWAKTNAGMGSLYRSAQ